MYVVEISGGAFNVIETYPSLDALEDVSGNAAGYEINPFPALYGYFGVNEFNYVVQSNEYYTGGLMIGEVPGSKMTLTAVNMGSSYNQIIKYAHHILDAAEQCKKFDAEVKDKCHWKSKK